MAALLLASASGCSEAPDRDRRFDLAQPVCLALGSALPIDAGQVERALREGVEQFGGRVTIERGCSQAVTVVYDAACKCTEPLCTSTTPRTAAYVGPWQWSVIHLCPRSYEAALSVGAAVAADVILKHELGHVFGLQQHLSAGTMMADVPDLNWPVRRFTAADVAVICAQHRISSPACD